MKAVALEDEKWEQVGSARKRRSGRMSRDGAAQRGGTCALGEPRPGVGWEHVEFRAEGGCDAR